MSAEKIAQARAILEKLKELMQDVEVFRALGEAFYDHDNAEYGGADIKYVGEDIEFETPSELMAGIFFSGISYIKLPPLDGVGKPREYFGAEAERIAEALEQLSEKKGMEASDAQ